ncbi:hypothetical protein CBM2633_U10031 [Cupriavidus taiwanensis]|nr:hypothetical protein CBM2633_U10031 [Cupriavidus taiwanensis]
MVYLYIPVVNLPIAVEILSVWTCPTNLWTARFAGSRLTASRFPVEKHRTTLRVALPFPTGRRLPTGSPGAMTNVDIEPDQLQQSARTGRPGVGVRLIAWT